MSEVTIDTLLSKAKNKFLLANAIAGRAKQIIDGSLPYVDDFNPASPVITALKEIAADKIKIKILAKGAPKPQPLLLEAEVKRPSLARERKKRKK